MDRLAEVRLRELLWEFEVEPLATALRETFAQRESGRDVAAYSGEKR